MSERLEKALGALEAGAAQYDEANALDVKDPNRVQLLTHGDTLIRIASVQAGIAHAEAAERIADVLEAQDSLDRRR